MNKNANIKNRIRDFAKRAKQHYESLAKKKYRNKMGISQDRLSKLADVTYNTIIKIESGGNKNPTIETLSKIAKALGVAVDDLIK